MDKFFAGDRRRRRDGEFFDLGMRRTGIKANRTATPAVKIIFMSGGGGAPASSLVLKKPFTVEQLLTAVQSALESKTTAGTNRSET